MTECADHRRFVDLLLVHGENAAVFDHTAPVMRIWACVAGRTPWRWSKLPGLPRDGRVFFLLLSDEVAALTAEGNLYFRSGHWDWDTGRRAWLTSELREDRR